jgi:uncharacterized membrane protein (UPF0127 family)
MRRVRVRVDGRELCLAEVAENPWTRTVGLLGRKRLGEGRGLWIRPCKSIHTFFMRFPIDVAYVSSDGTVVKICYRLRPFRLSTGGRGAHSVLELPAGTLERAALKVGDSLSYSPVDKETPDRPELNSG